MKTMRCGRWLLLGLFTGLTAVAVSEEPVAAPATNAAISRVIVAPAIDAIPVSTQEIPVEPTLIAEAPNPAAPPAVALESMAVDGERPISTGVSFGLDRPSAAYQQSDEEAQRRLEAPSPETLIERHGALGFLFRQPEARNFLDIINPFAPDNFGPREREVYNRDPNLKPGASLPRSFINDMVHEPGMALFDWTW